MSYVESALRDAAVEVSERDERGLVPLERARAVLDAATEVDRESLDAIWAAMLSLADGRELVERTKHLDWRFPVRGRDNLALVERYGAGALGWIATRVAHGVIVNHPWCVVPSLLALAEPAALELVLDAVGLLADAGDMKFHQFTATPVEELPSREELAEAATKLACEWTRLHPDAAFPVLARRARSNDRAREVLRRAAEGAPRDTRARLAAGGEPTLADELGLPAGLTASSILEKLDRACSGEGGGWPWFVCGVDGRTEYFDLRLVVFRAKDGDGWAIVLERLQGCDPDSFMLERFAYGPSAAGGADFDHSTSYETDFEIVPPEGGDEGTPVFAGCVARGPAGELLLDESLFARLDLKPGLACEFGGWAARTLAVRAYLADHPDAYFPDPEGAREASGLGDDAELFLVSRAFAHVSARPFDEQEEKPWNVLPSQSATYRSLAEAIVSGDASRFTPGDSNLDFRLHAAVDDEFVLPWRSHRVKIDAKVPDAWVKAAMAESPGPRDERGLVPLAEARALLASTKALSRGEGRYVERPSTPESATPGRVWVWDLDRTFAALVSLDDAREAAAVFRRLELVDPPRDAAKNLAFVERWGDDALALLTARTREDGVVVADSPILRATLLGLGTPAAFRFAWDVKGWLEPGDDADAESQATKLFIAWVSAHPRRGYIEFGRMVDAGDALALDYLTKWSRPQARRVFGWIRSELGEEAARRIFAKTGHAVDLAPMHVLALLDAHASGQVAGGDGWPHFRTEAGPSRELHGLRLIGARRPSSEDWLIVLERLEGYGPSAKVQRYAYSETLPTGLRPELALSRWEEVRVHGADVEPHEADAALVEPADHWTKVDGAPAQIARIRAVLRASPEKLWPPVEETLAAFGFGGVPPLVVTTSFLHASAVGEDEVPPPSKLRSFSSLAAALLANDASLFSPGESNVSPSLYVWTDDEARDEEGEDDEENDEDEDEPEEPQSE